MQESFVNNKDQTLVSRLDQLDGQILFVLINPLRDEKIGSLHDHFSKAIRNTLK